MNHDIAITGCPGFTFIEKAYIPNVSNIVVIAEEIKHLIESYFGTIAPPFTLINNLHFDCPQTLNTYDTIHICCLDTSWAQIAFQLSHELCHLMIGKPVTQNMRWFEECIAGVSSLFFMEKLASIWQQKGLLACPEYAPNILLYVHNRIESITTPCNLFEVSDPDSNLWKYLTVECYDRTFSISIAKHLLPVFQKFPDLWQVVPLLADLPNDLTFPEYIKIWISLSGESFQEPLHQLSLLFNVPCKTN